MSKSLNVSIQFPFTVPNFLPSTFSFPSHLLQFRKAPEGSPRKIKAQKEFVEAMSHRMHLDDSVKLVGKLLFGIKKAPEVLNAIRPTGVPLVDDWDCLKNLVLPPKFSLSSNALKILSLRFEYKMLICI